MSLATCPPLDDLERLCLSGLPESEAVELEQHVQECRPCLERLIALLPAHDTLSDAMAGRNTLGMPASAHPLVAELIRKLENIMPTGALKKPEVRMFTLNCSSCKRNLTVKEASADKMVKCPGCGAIMTVPVRAPAGGPESQPVWRGEATETPSERFAAQFGPDASVSATNPSLSKPDVTLGLEPDSSHDSSLSDFLAPPQADDELGRLGGYRILKILGHGGMGVVFLGEDPALNRKVAIKAMLPQLAQSKSSQQRFLREARTAAALEHDHIVAIHQVGEDRGAPYIVMPLLKGEPLDDRLKREPALPLSEVLRIGRETAEGLAAAHAIGLVHRDIKPANIWLESPRNRVKILDFGLARLAAQESGLTQQGAIIGTPAYMSPEQARGAAVDARCDLFSLGVVLYRMSTGRQPFHGEDIVSTLMEVAMHDPSPPVMVNFELPQELSDLVMKLLEKDSAKRVASAGVVIAALKKIEDELKRQQAITDQTEVVSFVSAKKGTTSVQEGGNKTNSAAGSAPRRRSKKPLLLMGLLFLGGLVVLAGGMDGIIRIATPEGDFVVNTDDPDFKFSVSKGTVTLEDTNTKRIYNMKATRKASGEYELDVTDAGADLSFKVKQFTIKRGEQFALKATFEPRQLVPVNPPPEFRTDSIVRKFQGHNDEVASVAMSGDGKYVVTGSKDSTAILWDAAGGKQIQTFKGHKGRVASVALSSDAKLVLTGSWDNTAILWEAATGEKLQTFQGTNKGVDCVALSGDGKHVVTTSGDQAILWETAGGKQIQTFPGHTAAVVNVALSGDGKLVLTGSFDNTAILWEAAGAKKLQTFKGHTAFVKSVALSGDGKFVVTGSNDLTAILWEAASGRKLQTFKGHTSGINCVALSGDGKLVFTGTNDKTAILWDAATGKKLHTLRGHTAQVYGVALSADGKHLVTGSKDGTAILWAFNAAPSQEPWEKLLATKDFSMWGKADGGQADAFKFVESETEPVLALRKVPKAAYLWSNRIMQSNHVRMDIKFPGKEAGHLQFAYMSPDGKSGLYFHLSQKGAVWVGPNPKMVQGLLERSVILPTGEKSLKGGAAILNPAGDWNQLDLVRVDDSVAVFINHRFVAAYTSIRRVRDGVDTDFGNVSFNLDCQNSEVWVRRVEVRDISALPEELIAAAPLPPLDPAWAKTVAAMKAEQQVEAVRAELMKRNPGFDGKAEYKLNKDGEVDRLEFFTDKVTDLSPVQALTKLQALECRGAAWGNRAPLADLSPLKDMKLRGLYCQNTSVSDLSPLKDMPLWSLNCGDTNVADLSSLKNLKELSWLDCGDTKVTDLSPLKGMSRMEFLKFYRTSVADLSPLQGMKLKELICGGTKVTDLSVLKGMPLKEIQIIPFPDRNIELIRSIPTLEKINGKDSKEFLKGEGASALPPLDPTWLQAIVAMKPEQQVEAVRAELMKRNPGFDGTMKEKIEGGSVTELRFLTDRVTDISPVRVLSGLRQLECNGTWPNKGQLADLSPLKGMNLTKMSCSATLVTDLSPLREMKLTVLWCPGTLVSDLGPLKGMPLNKLLIYNTKVSDLSPLKGMPMAELSCNETKLTDLSPLRGMPLKVLDWNFNAERDTEILRSIPTLEMINGKEAKEFLSSAKAAGLK
ncbi:protein kinase domain-containing protein [Zavarzinella formosa]|uniref:protein kinase domain-containing protein n=1 Tax=Zavarzinella formosa TaxID=360055 RepID=UPI0002FACFE1|nr:protein kinase [Zavarzinella formosa]